MTPFLFHPRTAPWFQTTANGVQLTLFCDANLPWQQVLLRLEPDNEEELHPMHLVQGGERLQIWQISLPLPANQPHHRYCFKCLTGDAQWWLHGAGVSAAMPLRATHFCYNPHQQPPAWVQDQVFYQIFPDRFCNGDPSLDVRDGQYRYQGQPVVRKRWGEPVSSHTDGTGACEFYGGDLAGIAQQLDYLQTLGVSALYLNPIFDSPSNHKYDTRDYYRIDPHLGSNALFAELTGELHRRGMRVILDAVVNHTSVEHPWFAPPEGAWQNPASPWRDFYSFSAEGEYVSWKGIRTLPKLDFASPRVQAQIYGANDAILRHWLQPPYGIDGWRLDVIHMLGEHGSAEGNARHVRAMRAAIKAENPDAYMLGEHFFEATNWLQGDQEDGAMNYYGFAHPIRAFLAGLDIAYHPIRISAAELDDWLRQARAPLPFANQLAQFNLLDSHDTARFLQLLGGDRDRMCLAVTLLMTYIGAPCIYYGDEVGMQGGNDPDCRRCFEWDEARQDQTLLAHYRRLIALRKAHPALRRGDIQTLHGGEHTLAYARTLAGDQLVIACNRNQSAPATLNLPLWQTGTSAQSLRDAESGERIAVIRGEAQITLPVNGARVLIAG